MQKNAEFLVWANTFYQIIFQYNELNLMKKRKGYMGHPETFL